ncbi:MAG: acylphosphatase [Chitinophagaceae bacterium]|nr:acylphosphatase [Chitinophagaceae bacterium]
MLRTVHIIVTGKVQGVFYRQHTKETAIATGVTGEVKNMPDSSVHIIATGNSVQLQELIEWCKQGPPKAKVTDVMVKEIEFRSFEKFSITR